MYLSMSSSPTTDRKKTPLLATPFGSRLRTRSVNVKHIHRACVFRRGLLRPVGRRGVLKSAGVKASEEVLEIMLAGLQLRIFITLLSRAQEEPYGADDNKPKPCPPMTPCPSQVVATGFEGFTSGRAAAPTGPLSAVSPPVTTNPMARWVDMSTGLTKARGTTTV